HSAMHAIKRERMVKRADPNAPLRIYLAEDGSYNLLDTATKRRFYLRAFGKDNAAVFARLLHMKPEAKDQNGEGEPWS
ncbi:MAG: photosynthetic complex assembly protein PuhC, partial [Pseudomonadota bacterium]